MVSNHLASSCQLIGTLEWYKALVLGVEKDGPEGDEGNDEEEEDEEEGEEEDEGEKPPLPQKKDGSVSALTVMQPLGNCLLGT